MLLARTPLADIISTLPGAMLAEAQLAILAIGGGLLYGITVLVMLYSLGIRLRRPRAG